ncbi:MAG: sigma-54 dependent transcriptional regulator [Bacteroidales bacterium]|jgi:two-component system nitrogen regulation response regulator GlnG|nr:sigma-54 dependent transcriptional regulator [Bacteroidales bacterium]NLM92096.1 sigma-54-dependent Fis family transcriptional regulator [Bacteroidales bacterium]
MYKILIVDDESSVRYSFRKLLAGSRYVLSEAENYEVGIKVFGELKPDLAIVDIEMPGKSGLELLQSFKEMAPHTPVIVITAFGSGDRVIKAMKYGAYEYIEKPFEIPQLISLIEEALKTTQAIPVDEITVSPANPKKKRFSHREDDKIIGESSAIKEVYKLIGRVAASDASILVTGESGTGKELVARAIHSYSERSSKPFITLNCAAIPETLLESELFGYDKGAFTGANKDKPGKFEEANGGTLFLDEIGDMGLAIQAKLLRMLQEGSFERLGSLRTQYANVRIITATNANLEALIQKKIFREDLYYRIRVVTIALPPLRLRKEDIPLLAKHFLKKHTHETRLENITIHPEALEKMMDYPWPGNIRELENTIKRAMILAKGNVITAELLSKEFMPPVVLPTQLEEGLNHYLKDEFIPREGAIFELVISSVEKDIISWALEKTGWNRAAAARLLGISRVMIHERMEKYGLEKKQ